MWLLHRDSYGVWSAEFLDYITAVFDIRVIYMSYALLKVCKKIFGKFASRRI